MRRTFVILFVGLGLVTGAATAAAPAPKTPERVTLIGDSVATALSWYPKGRSILSQGIDLQLQVAVCRRLTDESCPFEGFRPPTLLDVVTGLGRALGPIVIVVAGYNDYPQTFPTSVEESVAALLKAGVTRIFWATLSAARPSFLEMNDDLRAAAARHPELTIVDWSRYSQSHPEWFQNDGIHLQPVGGEALARLLRAALVPLGGAFPPQARVHRSAVQQRS